MSERADKALAVAVLYEMVNGEPYVYNKTPVTQINVEAFSKQDINKIIKTAMPYMTVTLKKKYVESLNNLHCLTVFDGYTLGQFHSIGDVNRYKLLYGKQVINFVLLDNQIYFPVTIMQMDYLVRTAVERGTEDEREYALQFLCECETMFADPIKYALNIAKEHYK